ncbi:ciliary microtubule inner protein 5 [Ranitomeya variabilis]|uniref:ciliary microtubule inner protein 5 n=1 Tax=Ranitomeya variabilis TaxID=490064 RepID=UPI004055A4EE
MCSPLRGFYFILSNTTKTSHLHLTTCCLTVRQPLRNFKTFPQNLTFAFKMGSRQISIRRATSAGYRMPDRTATKITSLSSVSLSKTHPGTRQIPSQSEKEKQTWGDAVRKDHVWREFVEAERRGEKLWHENWSFLKEYDSLGNKKAVETLPDNVPIFSDQVPNTTNQNIGSRINTDLGKTLVYMDFLLTSGNQKKKLGSELQPC